jgi:uncharacterized membrane protein YhiD involved in acid resistance
MKPIEFYISTGLASLALLATIFLVVITSANRSIEQALQDQQLRINRGQVSQQIGSALVRELANASVSNSKIRELLTKNGINVTVNN